jgi:hypothetical protein
MTVHDFFTSQTVAFVLSFIALISVILLFITDSPKKAKK